MQWDFIMDKQMYKVQLDQFEGPLDLLLYFIRRDEIDIYDIPISSITSEHLQIINDMKAMNLSVAGDKFIAFISFMICKYNEFISSRRFHSNGCNTYENKIKDFTTKAKLG